MPNGGVAASLSDFAPASSRLAHLVGWNPLAGAAIYLIAFGIARVRHDRRTLGRVHQMTLWRLTAMTLMPIVPFVVIAVRAASHLFLLR